MPDELKTMGEAYQKRSAEGFDAAVRSFGEASKAFQALTAEMTDYSKKVLDDGIRAWEQLLGVKSIEQAIRIQSDYARKVYDNHMAEMSKLGDMCVSLTRSAYKPIEQAVPTKAL